MTVTNERRNVFVEQGADFSQTFDYADAANGDLVEAELRQWSDGPLLAIFETSIDTVAKTVTISLSTTASAAILRSGYYDVEVINGSSVVTIASGYAKLRPRITVLPPGITWPAFDGFVWPSWDQVTWESF